MLTETEKNKIKNYFLVTEGLDIREVIEFHTYLLLKPYGAINFENKIYKDRELISFFPITKNSSDSDLFLLCGLEKITGLWISTQERKDFSFLLGIKNLTYLHIEKVPAISDISLLPVLPNLKKLILRNNNILDIKYLINYPNLTHLDLQNNEISDILILNSLKKLEYLVISYNNVSDISPLFELKNLKFLNVIANYSLKDSQIEELKNQLPNCIIW
jgi:internalin A